MREAIRTGQYAVGTGLPTEHQMAKHFGVWRMTVRKGLKELQKQGLIEKRRGAGSTISRRPWGAQFERTSDKALQAVEAIVEIRCVRFVGRGLRKLPREVAEQAQVTLEEMWLLLCGYSGETPRRAARIYIAPEFHRHLSDVDLQGPSICRQLVFLADEAIQEIRQTVRVPDGHSHFSNFD